ncbi:shikimate dehydrogenase family protein [Kocuria massiliensis]|uniref:shikimate dehydrogenase family protein n=1 Tax=Kocuria massiliensis TaxID=1926282 RepID=UPI0022B9C9CD|nr:shikimate dehydrogenase [Kocuria massiliensis]
MLLIDPPAWPWAAVLGHPVGHSLSPVMHRAAYRVLHEDIAYTSADIQEAEFGEAVGPALTDPGWSGFSVTMPLKSVARGAADRLTDFASLVGVINTLAPLGPGDRREVVGHNTDVSGIVNALSFAHPDMPASPRAAIIGGGGTATAAAAAVHILGASEVTAFVRDPERAGRVVQIAERLGTRLELSPLNESPTRMGEFDVVVSTLPAHAFDDQAERIDGDLSGLALLDVSYEPWPSELAVSLGRHGAVAVSGREMLLYQAIDQIKMFTGRDLSEDLPRQDEVLTAMSEAIGLPPRTSPPRKIYDGRDLRPRG